MPALVGGLLGLLCVVCAVVGIFVLEVLEGISIEFPGRKTVAEGSTSTSFCG